MFNGLYFVVACFETICYKIILIKGSGLFSAVGGQLKKLQRLLFCISFETIMITNITIANRQAESMH